MSLPEKVSSEVQVPREVAEFIGEHHLQADFIRYCSILDRIFGAGGATAFRVSVDPEVESFTCIEATVRVENDVDKTIALYGDYLQRFGKEITHEHQEYFCLSFQNVQPWKAGNNYWPGSMII